ncbi:hypothetical protein IGI04_026263, partial [Brassica rapa subsp. trilocularis]
MRHVSGFVFAQSGDTDKAKKIRKPPSSPSPSSLAIPLPAISYYGRSLRLYARFAPTKRLLLQPPFPTPPSTLSALEGPLSPLLVGSSDSRIPGTLTRMEILLNYFTQGADLLRRRATRHDASSFTILETLMNHKANIRALPPLSLKREEKWSAAFWKMVTWSLQDEDGTRYEEDEEKCYLEYPNVEDVD